MKNYKLILIILILLISASDSRSQNQPSLQFTGGFAFPGKEFEGDLVTVNDSGITYISSEFIKDNYAASTGATITGNLRFPIIGSGSLSGIITGSYTFFNAFRQSNLGTTLINNVAVPVTFDNRFTTSTFALGIEASPIPDAAFSPYVNASLSMNILSLSLLVNDVTSVIFNDAFRMGLLTNAGVNYRINNEYSVLLSGSYHMSNLFLKSQNDSYADRIGFNRESIPINDEQGLFYSNLSNPDSVPVLVNGQSKNVSWWGINLGLSIVLGKSKKK